jgi:N-acetylmuramoyl-L-alanine amidase
MLRETTSAQRFPLIAIDPGHGAGWLKPNVLDEGAVAYHKGARYAEQELALRYAIALDEELHKRGVNTVLTRTDSRTNSSPQRRKELCSGASLALSLHFSKSLNPEDRGFELAAPPELEALSQAVREALEMWLPCRDVSAVSSSLDCVRAVHLGCPSLEIRPGVLTSCQDMELITSAYWKVLFAERIAQAVDQHFEFASCARAATR